MTSYSKARLVADIFAALSEPTRLQVLYRLLERPWCVGDLARDVHVPMVGMSHHLNVLKQARLVKTHKDGRHVVYQLREEYLRPASASESANAEGSLGVITVEGYQLFVLPMHRKVVKLPARGTRRSVRTMVPTEETPPKENATANRPMDHIMIA